MASSNSCSAVAYVSVYGIVCVVRPISRDVASTAIIKYQYKYKYLSFHYKYRSSTHEYVTLILTTYSHHYCGYIPVVLCKTFEMCIKQ